MAAAAFKSNNATFDSIKAYVPQRGAYVKPTLGVNMRQRHWSVELSPSSTPASTVPQSSSSTQVDFYLEPSAVPDYLDMIAVRMTISNADGANSITITPLNLFQYVQFWINDAQLTEQYTPRCHFFPEASFHTTEDLQKLWFCQGISPTTFVSAGTAVIGASSSQTYLVVIENPFVSMKLPNLSNKIRPKISLFLSGGANLKQAGAAAVSSLTLTNMKLVCSGYDESDATRSEKRAELEARGKIRYQFIANREDIVQTGMNAVAGQQYKLPLLKVGYMSHVWVFAQSQAAQAGDNYSFTGLALDQVDFIDSAGQSITGYQNGAPANFVRGPLALGPVLSTMPTVLNTQLFYWNEDVISTLKTGCNYGHQHFKNQGEQIQFTPVGSTADLNLILVWGVYYQCEIDFNTGAVSCNSI